MKGILCEVLGRNRFFHWKILHCSVSLQGQHVSAKNQYTTIRSHNYVTGAMMKDCDYITLFTRNEISYVLQSIVLQICFPKMHSSVNVPRYFIPCLYCSLTSLFPYSCHRIIIENIQPSSIDSIIVIMSF